MHESRCAHRERCERLLHAMEAHGTFNTYYLYNARCVFHLTNHDDVGMLEFGFEFRDCAGSRCKINDSLLFDLNLCFGCVFYILDIFFC